MQGSLTPALVLGALALAACSAPEPSARARHEAGPLGGACEAFEPFEIETDTHPSSLRYDPEAGALYLVDDDTNRVVVRGEDGEITVVAGIDGADPTADALGELALGEGVLYLARSGFGESAIGAVYRLRSGEPAQRIPGLSGDVRRVGLVPSSDGGLFAASQHRSSDGSFVGGIDRIDPEGGGEQPLTGGLVRPTGLARLADGALAVAQPAEGVLYRFDPSNPSAGPEPLATGIAGVDRLAERGDGIVATAFDPATETGAVIGIASDGTQTTLAEGAWQPRGVAVDPAGRIFVSTRGSSAILVAPACK